MSTKKRRKPKPDTIQSLRRERTNLQGDVHKLKKHNQDLARVLGMAAAIIDGLMKNPNDAEIRERAAQLLGLLSASRGQKTQGRVQRMNGHKVR